MDNNTRVNNELEEYLKVVRNFKIPNKKSYSILPKKDNDERLDNVLNIKYLLNDILNSTNFYNRNIYFRHNAIAFIGEYFCRYLGFDGIFINVKEIDDTTHNIIEFVDDKINAYIYSNESLLENEINESESITCKYLLQIIKELCKMKQLEKCSLFFNGYDFTSYNSYCSYLTFMIETIILHNKKYNIYKNLSTNITIVDLSIYSTLINILHNFLLNNNHNIEISNYKLIIQNLLFLISKFILGTKNQPTDLQLIFNNALEIRNSFENYFYNSELTKDILYAFDNFSIYDIEEKYNSIIDNIKLIYDYYNQEYINLMQPFLSQKYLDIANRLIEENGNAYLPYALQALYFKSCNSNLGFEYYLKLYNDYFKQNSFENILKEMDN